MISRRLARWRTMPRVGGVSKGRKARTYSQTARVLMLLTDLQARSAPARLSELAAALGVTERQLRRDCGALEEAGHALSWSLDGGRAAVSLEHGGASPLVLSQRERFSLLAVQKVFVGLEGTPFAEDVGRIVARTSKRAPAGEREDWARRVTYVADTGVKPYDDEQKELLDTLLTALIHKNPVDVSYRTAKRGIKTGAFEPWGIAIYRHGVYFVGHFPGGNHPYVLPLERFSAATRRRKERFETPEGFDVAEVFRDTYGILLGGKPVEVVLELAASVAHLVEVRRFHHSQRATPLVGGRVRLTMRVAETEDLVSGILSWGERITVVAPESLRQRVRDVLRAALQMNG